MKSVEFHQPVSVGDVLSYWSEVAQVGDTSITMQIDVETERNGNTIKLTEAEVTYVAVTMEKERKPVQIRGH